MSRVLHGTSFDDLGVNQYGSRFTLHLGISFNLGYKNKDNMRVTKQAVHVTD